MNDSVNYEIHGEVVLITLDRPKANAIDVKTSYELGEAFIRFRDDYNLRTAVTVSYTHLTLPTTPYV